MTGPEHYREAERLLAEADETRPMTSTEVQARLDRREALVHRDIGAIRAELAERAQVHATLAVAAATAMTGTTGRAAAAWEAVVLS